MLEFLYLVKSSLSPYNVCVMIWLSVIIKEVNTKWLIFQVNFFDISVKKQTFISTNLTPQPTIGMIFSTVVFGYIAYDLLLWKIWWMYDNVTAFCGLQLCGVTWVVYSMCCHAFSSISKFRHCCLILLFDVNLCARYLL